MFGRKIFAIIISIVKLIGAGHKSLKHLAATAELASIRNKSSSAAICSYKTCSENHVMASSVAANS